MIYQIKYQVENSVTGCTPQVDFDREKVDKKLLRSLKRYSVNQLKKCNIEFPRLMLLEDSNLTDLISSFALSAAKGKIISESLFQYVTSKRIMHYENFPLDIYEEKKTYRYNYFDLLSEDSDKFIDFCRSQFVRVPGDIELSIDSVEDFYKEQLLSSSSYVRWRKLVLKKDIFEYYDIVKFGYGDLFWYFNDSTILSEIKSMSGLSIVEFDNIEVMDL